jgi:hypothetical protein
MRIDGDEYAGWDATKYGTGDRTFVGHGYGYAVLGEDFGVKWHSCLKPRNE